MFSKKDDVQEANDELDQLKFVMSGLTNEYGRLLLALYFMKPFIVIMLSKARKIPLSRTYYTYQMFF